MEEKCVYNPQEDSAVSITQEEGLLYSNLRYGNQYEMSDATLEYIENCIENDKIEQLRNTVGLSVTMEDGFTFIEEVPVTRVAPPPTNENEVVNTLKSDFPQYGKKEIYSTTGDCTALGKSVSIKVYESRTAYVKKSVNIAALCCRDNTICYYDGYWCFWSRACSCHSFRFEYCIYRSD